MDADKPASRLFFLDGIKLALVALVIVHHAGQPYGTDDWPIRSEARWEALDAFFDVNGAFFMGLFFMISGYVLPGSIDRKGAGRMVSDRLIRLGIPVLAMTLFVFGPLKWAFDRPVQGFWDYMIGHYLSRGDFEVAHLWFLSLLLLFTLAYVVWRLALGRQMSDPVRSEPPGHGALLLTVAGLALANAAIRQLFPTGEWVQPLPLLSLEPARLPQYVLFFTLGVLAAHRNGLLSASPQMGAIWLAIGLTAAGLRLAVPLPEPVWLLTEAFIGVGLCIGIPVVARDLVGGPLESWRGWSDAAFAAYLIHVFIVYALQVAAEEIPSGPVLKFAAVSLPSVVLSFVLARQLLRAPGLGRIL